MSATPPNYGTTIGYYCMTPTMSVLTGVDCVADDIMVRLSTGNLWYDPNFGIDADDLVGCSFANPANIINEIVSQVQLDPRVATCSATGSFAETTLTLNLNITLSGNETFQIIGTASTLNASTFQFSYAAFP